MSLKLFICKKELFLKVAIDCRKLISGTGVLNFIRTRATTLSPLIDATHNCTLFSIILCHLYNNNYYLV